MKKIISLLLAVMLLASLSVTALAEDVTPSAGSSSQTVTASYNAGTDSAATVYYVTVDWTCSSNDIAYSAGTTVYTWNAEELTYSETAPNDAGWSGTASYTVTVKNRSNAPVNASAAWTPAKGITVGATVGDPITVSTAAKGFGETGAEQTGTIAVDVATPTAGSVSSNGAVIGTITVTISK